MYMIYTRSVITWGGMSYGHYYVYIKNSENKWILFNDDSVSVIDDIENCFLSSRIPSFTEFGRRR
jgi:uncharacterized UBP type Zn finger protein